MILLTGGTGFVGHHLVQQFIADGHHVRVLSRTPGRIALPASASWVLGDLTDPDSLPAALCDVDIVVHAGGVLHEGSRSEASLERVNVGGTKAIARVARDSGVRKFVHISSAGVYGDGCTAAPHCESDTPAPVNPYERSKLSAEHALIATLEGSNVNWTILRPQGLYGPDRAATVDFFRAVATKRLWLHGPSRVVVHPTHIGDLTAAVQLVLDRNDLQHEIINIGGARWLEYCELVSLTGTSVGHVPFQICAPRWTRQIAAFTARAVRSVGRRHAPIERLSRAWINRAVSIEKARRLLGFEPLALESGLNQTATELRRRVLL